MVIVTATLRTARKPRPCGSYRCDNTINRGDRFVRHVAFPGQDGHEYGTHPRVLEQCSTCVGRDLSYIADRYGVPVSLGSPVRFQGVPHVVVGMSSGSLLVQPEAGGPVVPIHPKWQTEYPAVAAP